MTRSVKKAESHSLPQAWRDVESVEGAFFGLSRNVPVALAIRETHRFCELRRILASLSPVPETVLDIGCGDGSWWSAIGGHAHAVYGVDISTRELQLAKSRLKETALIDIAHPETPSKLRSRGWPSQFDCIIANCSLEHVFELSNVLKNVHRLLSPQGHFILFVPTPTWAFQGKVLGYLLKVFPRLGMAASGAINGFFQHWHLYDDSLWVSLLASHGLKVSQTGYLGTRNSEFLFRIGLGPAFFAFLVKAVVGHYPNRYAPKWLHALGMKAYSFLVGAPWKEVMQWQSEDPRTANEYSFVCEKIR